MRVRTLCDYVAAELDRQLGPTLRGVHTAEHGFGSSRTSSKHSLLLDAAGLAVAEGVIDPPGHIALRRHYVELRQPPMFDGPCGFDKLLGPRDRLVLFDNAPKNVA